MVLAYIAICASSITLLVLGVSLGASSLAKLVRERRQAKQRAREQLRAELDSLRAALRIELAAYRAWQRITVQLGKLERGN